MSINLRSLRGKYFSATKGCTVITVRCHGCHVRLKVSDLRSKSIIHCPRCGASVQVSQSHPEFSPILSQPATPSTSHLPDNFVDISGNQQSVSGHNNDCASPMVYRRLSYDRKVWLYFVISITTVFAMFVVIVIYMYSNGHKISTADVRKIDGTKSLGPKSSIPQVSCSLSELVECLMKYKLGSNVMYLSLTSRDAVPFANLKQGKVPSAFIDGTPGRAKITVFECDDEFSAKHGAHFTNRIAADKAFSWGRFGFLVEDNELANRVKNLLRVD